MAATVLHTNDMKETYMVSRNLPTIWCEGCGIGTVLASVMRAIHKLEIARQDVAFAIGIGCSGYSSRYVNFDVGHISHGRAIAAATGMKLAKPNMKVVVLTGDGDCTAIGGNHFIHAARRNIDITTIIFNNNIYGMTGGQYSPATPFGSITTTSPFGMTEGQIDPCELAKAAGATFVARSSTFHVNHLIDVIAEAITHPGFSVVEALTQCPNQFGKLNKLGTPTNMMLAFKEKCVRVDGPRPKSAAEIVAAGKTPIGILHRGDRPEFTAEYEKVRTAAKDRAASR